MADMNELPQGTPPAHNGAGGHHEEPAASVDP